VQLMLNIRTLDQLDAPLRRSSKHNEMLTLAEIEQYGLDSFADTDYVSIYHGRRVHP
jgi:hypothetical protein